MFPDGFTTTVAIDALFMKNGLSIVHSILAHRFLNAAAILLIAAAACACVPFNLGMLSVQSRDPFWVSLSVKDHGFIVVSRVLRSPFSCPNFAGLFIIALLSLDVFMAAARFRFRYSATINAKSGTGASLDSLLITFHHSGRTALAYAPVRRNAHFATLNAESSINAASFVWRVSHAI